MGMITSEHLMIRAEMLDGEHDALEAAGLSEWPGCPGRSRELLQVLSTEMRALAAMGYGQAPRILPDPRETEARHGEEERGRRQGAPEGRRRQRDEPAPAGERAAPAEAGQDQADGRPERGGRPAGEEGRQEGQLSARGAEYLIRVHSDDASQLEQMLGHGIVIAPAYGHGSGSVRITGLDAVFPEELGEVIERLRTGGPRYHAGGPG